MKEILLWLVFVFLGAIVLDATKGVGGKALLLNDAPAASAANPG